MMVIPSSKRTETVEHSTLTLTCVNQSSKQMLNCCLINQLFPGFLFPIFLLLFYAKIVLAPAYPGKECVWSLISEVSTRTNSFGASSDLGYFSFLPGGYCKGKLDKTLQGLIIASLLLISSALQEA